ncbi:M48 family metallopeptidase [Undibacterium sp. Tian12W]|uniref:M48 family metallopeptidase n=1 Tax=Undibacterium sp. Tian12W TaxID=3413054 RepID=UPI003BF437F8
MRTLQKLAIAGLTLVLCGSAIAQGGIFGQILDATRGKTGVAGDIFDKAKPIIENAGIDEAKEIEIGNEFAAVLLGAKPLLNDPALQRYVNTLGRWLASQTERPDLPWTFGVLDDVGFNAFATPGGKIFVTKGLLARMRNEAELVGVLSHEIAHVVLKHHVNAMQSKAWVDVAGDFASSKFKGNLAEFKSMAVNLGKDMITKGFDKGDEYAADRVGVVIAARAGFDPYGLPNVLQTLQAQSAQDGNFNLLFKTHPSPTDRLDNLDKVMRNRFESTNGSQGRSFSDRLKEFSR